jgi:hypothetical protein
MLRIIRDLVIGVAIVALVFLGLANLPLPAGAFDYMEAIIAAFNAVMLAVAIAMMAIGLRKRRPGLIAAPLVFAALWCSLAVAQRAMIQARDDPKLAQRPVPTELSGVRTLIIESQLSPQCCGHIALLGDRRIDRYVHAFQNNDRWVVRFVSTRLARPDECSADDTSQSAALARAGYTDECISSERIGAMPDGVVVRVQPFARALSATGCCNRGTISLRNAGREQLVATWYYGRRAVLSYLPVFASVGLGEPSPLWAVGRGGPGQFVEIGGPAFRPEDLAAAIYGIDWRAPVNPAPVDAPELARRAVQLTKLERYAERLPALEIAVSTQTAGFVNDDLLRVVASFVEHAGMNTTAHRQILQFYDRLNDDQKLAFLDIVMARIDSPTEGQDFSNTDLSFAVPASARQRITRRAEAIFAERRDLTIWQYELALRLARDTRLTKRSDEIAQQRRFFQLLLNDDTDAFPLRAIAFKRVHNRKTDEERAAFAKRLDRVPDVLLGEYVRETGWLRGADERSTSDVTYAFRRSAIARIAAVADERLRKDLRERYPDERRE